MKFNVNDHVKVQLTEEGKRVHHEWWEKNTPPEYKYQAPEEKDGWSEWQLWHLMQVFGPVLWNGCNIPFAMFIEIPEAKRHG